MRCVVVFPSREEHPAVLHHDGVPVVILIEGETALVGAVIVHDVHVAHVRCAGARYRLLARRGDEHDLPVRQAAGVVVLEQVFLR